MSRNDHFQILQIKTCALKVNIHCHGCEEKVKKILKKIEGVYSVDVDAEKQKVDVWGNVDSTTLIKKLLRSGKYAEPWPSTDQNQHISTVINQNQMQEQEQEQEQDMITTPNHPKPPPLMTPGGLEDQLSLERYLRQSTGMGEREHNFISTIDNMRWDDGATVDNTSGFIDLEGSQLGGFGRSFNGGQQTYHHHQPPMQMMNMCQQSHPPPPPPTMNMNVQKMYDNMYTNHAPPMFRHAHYY